MRCLDGITDSRDMNLSKLQEIVYTRIIRVGFRPLRYNNRQQGQKADQYHKFKLTGTHKNYAPASGTGTGVKVLHNR